MRRAFVFQLSSKATEDQIEGRIEHVDSGMSRHFHSIEEAVCFVRQVLAETESIEEIEGESIIADSERS